MRADYFGGPGGTIFGMGCIIGMFLIDIAGAAEPDAAALAAGSAPPIPANVF